MIFSVTARLALAMALETAPDAAAEEPGPVEVAGAEASDESPGEPGAPVTDEASTDAPSESESESESPSEAASPDSAPEPRPTAQETPEPQPDKPEPVGRARLRGRVLIFGDRDPAAGARLIPKDGSEPIETDENGEFSADLPPGKHAMIIRAPGFEELEVEVFLADTQDLQMEYFLEPALNGTRYRTVVEHDREVAVSSTTLREAELREVPGTRGDPLRVINSLPGVSQLSGFLPYVVVRGAAPGNTGYYLDGTRVPLLFHVAIGPSVIHPYFIDAVDFYPGGAPVRLGRYTSGMIEARTRPARRDRVHGEVDLRLIDAGALLEVPISRPLLPGCEETKRRRAKCEKGKPRGALTLAGRYSYTGLLLSAVQQTARIRYWDYQARFDHDLGPRARYTAFAYGSYDDLGQRNPDGSRTTFLRFNFHRVDNRITSRLPGGGRGTYAVVLGLDESGIDVLKTVEYRIAPRFDFRVPTKLKTVELGFGLDQEFQFFRLRDDTPEGEDDGITDADLALLFSDRFVSATGAYFEVIFEKGIVQVRPGMRADLYSQVGSSPYLPSGNSTTSAFGVDPRILLREQVAPRWALKQALGIYHQPPSFPIPVPGIESFGFERGLQRNTQGAFGYEFQVLPEKLSLHQEAYLGYLSNLQDYELGEELEDDPLNELEDVITQVTGWAYGLETMLKLDPQLRVFGWAAYTLSRATRDFRVGGSAPANWDQRHIFNFVLGYRISHKWNIGSRVHYHTGRPWTARDDNQSQLQALSNNRNNARLPAFFQLDLRVERTWRWPLWQLSAVMDVANATYSYETYQCTGEDNTTFDEPGFVPRAAGGARRSGAPTQLQQIVNPAQGLVQCTPTGFRYVIPSLGLRARW